MEKIATLSVRMTLIYHMAKSYVSLTILMSPPPPPKKKNNNIKPKKPKGSDHSHINEQINIYAELDMFMWITNNIKTMQRKVLSVSQFLIFKSHADKQIF